jgi:hypothetical protein
MYFSTMFLQWLATSPNSVRHLCITEAESIYDGGRVGAVCGHKPRDGQWMFPTFTPACKVCLMIDNSGATEIVLRTEEGELRVIREGRSEA